MHGAQLSEREWIIPGSSGNMNGKRLFRSIKWSDIFETIKSLCKFFFSWLLNTGKKFVLSPLGSCITFQVVSDLLNTTEANRLART